MKIGPGLRSVLVGLGIVWLSSVRALADASPDPLDWPYWRGPEQNGVSRETGLINRFDPRGEVGSNVLWKNAEAAGISTPIVKITLIPKGTRSQSWMGLADLHDYTIQADLKAVGSEDKLPDMGVIAQRYTLDIMGESQQLQIRTWSPQLRMAQTIPFVCRQDIWYRVKLRASVEDGKPMLRGKVWPRQEAEPDNRTITASDEAPNVVGSPGLYGNATNAEIFIDNVAVTPNAP